ncbi:MAG: hypothetical protein A3K09_07975 [Nitrospinae bacterium RIFCSPLOWO2_12_FULL_47_7]|nr:MAG: hypothetical protein A3K09_07975 [Nitrospinae bacterium RIFCSPLOWO2_12_FULL_47_7]
MITINLYDYRQQVRNTAIQKQVVAAAGVMLMSAALILANWFVEEINRDNLKIAIIEVEGKIKAIEGKVQAVLAMKKKQKRVLQIVDGIQTLKTGQYLSMTRLLEDLGNALPENIWLEGIVQANWQDLEKKKVPLIFIKNPAEKPQDKKEEFYNFVEIKGKAISDDAIPRFIEGLEKISYFKTVFLFKKEVEEDKFNPVHGFTVYCYIGEIKIAA